MRAGGDGEEGKGLGKRKVCEEMKEREKGERAEKVGREEGKEGGREERRKVELSDLLTCLRLETEMSFYFLHQNSTHSSYNGVQFKLHE